MDFPQSAIPPFDDESPASAEPGELVARLISQSDSRVVVEIELPAALDWRPKRARLILSDGSSVRATVDRRRSTRSGEMQPGHVVRLVLELEGPLAAALQRIDLEQKGQPALQLRVQ
jgi:hypothetical protein